MQFIRGRKDKVKRKVAELIEPEIPKKKFGVPDLKPGYAICQMELTPGNFATQLVNTSRIEHEKEAA